MNDRKFGTLITAAMYIVLLVVAFLSSMLVEENLLRIKHDKTHSRSNSVYSVTNEPYSATS